MDYLPPIVISVWGEAREFRSTLADVVASLRAMPDKKTVIFGADGRPLAAAVGEAEAELDALDARVVEPTIRPRVDYGGLGLLASARTTAGASAIASALGLALADRGGGGNGGGGGWGRLLWGGITGGFAGFAGLGSLGSFLGLGAEHATFTGLGLGASAVQAGIGGGLLGLGALGVGGVGFGTDLAGFGQAAGDIKTVNSDLSSLNQAIALYGKNSQQAAQAQTQLNYDLGSFSPVARQAVLGAAQTAQQFKAMFDQATGLAEKYGAQILTQLMQTGEKFLPVIGQFASQNMVIIQRTMQPLMSWLTDSSRMGGLGIFTDLEQLFQKDLPTGMHALTQGIELFAKTVDVAAQYTGPFLTAIDNFLTRTNTTGFSRWAAEIGTLIGTFRTWLDLFITVGKTIWDVFQPAAGAAAAIVQTITGLFSQLNQFLTSSGMKNALSQLFNAHLLQITQGFAPLLQAVLQLLEPVVQGLVQFLTVGAQVGTRILQALTPAVKALQPIFTALGPLIATVGRAMATLLSGAVRALAPLVVTLAQGLSSLLVPILNTVNRVLVSLMPVFTQVANALGPVIAPLVSALGQLFTALLPPLTKVIEQLGPILTPAITKLGNQLVTAMSQGLTPFLQALTPLVPAFSKVLVALLPLIPALTKLFVTVIEQSVIPNLPQMNQLLVAMTKLLTNKELVPAINAIAGALTAMANAASGALNLLSAVGLASGKGGGLPGLVGRGISDVGSFLGIGGHALGTGFAPGGWSLVGERGPELMRVPWGASIIPARQTQRMLSYGGNQTNHITVKTITNASSRRISRDIAWELRGIRY